MADGPSRTTHATAIVVGETGLLITGPSGAGKTMLALRCLQAAGLLGWHHALVADDRVRLDAACGMLLARSPASIAGLAEVRGSGLVLVPACPVAVIHVVVAPGAASGADRVPVENETADFEGLALPVLRILYDAPADPLAVLRLLGQRFFAADA
ncbi:Hpr(Ser) kinase/phosphatase [Hoeflea marina]|uniref:Hpr(Ser) kinase/phosphatase n=1 Tax=Hoeflea marina TaxID=274592 RepID=A0A317PIU9_9HYPH|nr:serine/threonine protein kinase [Hoeflea marina]PWW00519.1 Hpr(Ser) kinase/phosphatase [Hoeflea marina]